LRYYTSINWLLETLNKIVDAELEMLAPPFKAKFLHIAEMLESLEPQHVREPLWSLPDND